MEMTTETAAQIVKGFSDDALRQASVGLIGRPSSFNAVRDSQGRLRDLTDGERIFTAAIKAEFRARFLGL